MLKGRWHRNYTIGLVLAFILALAVGGWLWSTSADLEDRIHRQAAEYSAQYAKSADVSIERECPAVATPERRICVAEKREAARDRQRKEYDLEAQQAMAVWTIAMGKAAIIGMGVGVFGLGLIFTTFRETRKAADSATKTHSAFIAVERPRLKLKVYHAWRDGEAIYVRVDAENVGKTTAYMTAVYYNALEDRYPDKPFRLIEDINRPVHPTDSVEAFSLGSNIIDKSPYLGGYVEYQSPFDSSHKAYFCVRLTDHPPDGYGGGGPKAQDTKQEGWPKDT